MKTFLRWSIIVIWLLVVTVAITYWWFNSLAAIPLSESLWTWFNHLLGEQTPGVATDLEFVAVLIGGFCIAASATRALFTLARRMRKKQISP